MYGLLHAQAIRSTITVDISLDARNAAECGNAVDLVLFSLTSATLGNTRRTASSTGTWRVTATRLPFVHGPLLRWHLDKFMSASFVSWIQIDEMTKGVCHILVDRPD